MIIYFYYISGPAAPRTEPRPTKPKAVARKLDVNATVPVPAPRAPALKQRQNEQRGNVSKSRLERHQNMFKSRTANETRGTRDKRTQMLRGVRLNRRFELQMKFREQGE